LIDAQILSSEFFGTFTSSGLSSWTVGTTKVVSSQCGMDIMVGGAYNYGGSASLTKTFSILGAHYKIGVYIDFYKIDNWNDASFIIQAGSGTLSTIYSQSFASTTDETYVRNLCAGCDNEDYRDVYQETPYFSSSITISFSTTLTETDAYWGVNNFVLYVFDCDANCLTCETNSTYCLSCSSGKYLISSLHTCDISCPFLFYKNSATNTCDACSTSCASCNGASSSNCLICFTGYYLSSGNCIGCASECSACETSSTYCLSCSASLYLFNNSCQSSCPMQYYERLDDCTCQKCDSSCLTCSGSGVSGCTSCANGYYLYPSPNGSCSKCDISCKTCVNSATDCTSCNTGTFYYQSGCKTTCPNGYWPRSTDNSCQACDSSCAKCTGALATNCIACPNGDYLSASQCLACFGCKTCVSTSSNCLSCVLPKLLNINNCVDSCPNGTWEKSSDNTCQICDSSCKTCSAGAASDCSSCNDGDYLKGTTCLSCSSICKTCAISQTNCSSCNSGSFLLSSNCLLQCTAGNWPDSSTNTCNPCDNSCVTCQAPGTSASCLSCSSGFYLNGNQCLACASPCFTCHDTSTTCTTCTGSYYYYSNQCMATCPDGYYSDDSSNLCLLCDISCLTCSGEFSSNCNSCFSGYALSNLRCVHCYQNCLTCDGIGSDNCLTCNSTLYYEEKSCVSTCKDGYYQTETPIKQCIRCSTTCLSCLSSDFNNCSTCASNCYFTLLNPQNNSGSCTYMSCPFSYYMDLSTHTCVKACNSSQYLDTTTKQCKMCDVSCLTCSAAGSGHCLSCSSPNFLIENSCLSNCITNFYAETKDRICKPCPTNCDICVDSSTCTNCTVGYFLNSVYFNCSDVSPTGQFISTTDGKILTCAFGCYMCETFPQCIECENLFYLSSEQICIEEKHVQPILYSDPNITNLYFLTFNDTWTNFFNNLTNNGTSENVSLENAEDGAYTINFRYYQFNSTPNWEIIVNFNNDSLNTTTLVVNLYPIDENPFNLTETQVSIDVPPYLLSNSAAAEELIYVIPSLSYISSENCTFNLSFSDNFTDFFDIMPNITNIIIDNLEITDFNYTINQTNSTLNYNVGLILKKTLMNDPLLTIHFDLPGYIILHPSYRLTKNNVTVNLIDYFILNPSDQSQMKTFLNAQNFFSNSFGALATIAGVLNMGSVSFSGLAATKIIKYLRYLSINYSPPALLVFQLDLSGIKLFQNSDDNENIDEIPLVWQKEYGIFANFFANGKDKFLQIVIFLGIAIFLKVLSISIAKTHRTLAKILKELIKLFYLNLVLMFYLSYLMDLSFYCFLNLRYYTFASSIGVLSFLTSLSFFIITIMVQYLLFKIIIIVDSPKKIIPILPNVFQESKNDSNSILKDSGRLSETSRSIMPPTSPSIMPPPTRTHLKNQIWWDNDNAGEFSFDQANWVKDGSTVANWIKDGSTVMDQKKSSFTENNKENINQNIENPEKSTEIGNEQGIKETIKILLCDYQQVSRTQKIYILLLMWRYIILPFFVVMAHGQTLFLIVFYFSFNLMYLAYILCLQPFKSLFLFVCNVIIEIGIMVGITGALLLYSSELEGTDDYTERMINGWLICYGNTIVLITIGVLYIFSIMVFLVQAGHKMLRWYQNRKNKKIYPGKMEK